ncbi:MAG: DUF4377 domain-containing protein, partial [Flavobacterium sp.]
MLKIIKDLKTLIAILTIATISLSCEKIEEPIRFRVNQFKQTAVGVSPIMTLSVQQGSQIGTNNWSPLYNDILGFTYEPGYIYELLVTETDILNPPADGSSKAYRLKQILSKTKVSTNDAFTLNLKLNETVFVKGNVNTGYNILEEVKIDCGNLCNEFNLALQSNATNLKGNFVLNDDGSIKLI